MNFFIVDKYGSKLELHKQIWVEVSHVELKKNLSNGLGQGQTDEQTWFPHMASLLTMQRRPKNSEHDNATNIGQ
jgi:hypothetical protein